MGLDVKYWGEIAARITAGLSVFGSGTVIILFIYFKWWQSSTHHVLLCCISAADILYSIAVFCASRTFGNRAACTWQGWTQHAMGLSAQAWCMLVGVNLLLQMKLYWHDARCRSLMPYWHLFAWGVPSLLATIPTAQGYMSELAVFCWINSAYPGLRMLTFYIPMWTMFGVNCLVLFFVFRSLLFVMKNLPDDDPERRREMRSHFRAVVAQTSMFVIAGMITWIPGTINRIWQATNDKGYSPPEVGFMQLTFMPMQGIFNLMVYVAPAEIKKLYRKRKRVHEIPKKVNLQNGGVEDEHRRTSAFATQNQNMNFYEMKVGNQRVSLLDAPRTTLDLKASDMTVSEISAISKTYDNEL